MANIYTEYTGTSAITAARTQQTEVVSISARPQISYIKPEFDSVPRSVVDFTTNFTVYGYNFTTVSAVFVSAGGGVYTNQLSAVSSYNPFVEVRVLSAMYPAFNGRRLPNEDFNLINHNIMTVVFSACQAQGNADIIIVNVAGYCTLYNDLSGRIVNVTV